MLKKLIPLLFIFPSLAGAVATVNQSYTNVPTQVCQPNDTGAGCTGVAGASYWTLSGSNLYPSSTAYTLTVGNQTTSLDTFTVNSLSGGATINSGTAGIGGIDSNTQLMLHLNNNVTDSSQNAFTVTNSGFTFANTSPQFTGVYYGVSSNYLSAVLSIPQNNVFNFGSGNFTIDFWINPTTLTGDTDQAAWLNYTNTNNYEALFVNSNGSLQFIDYEGGTQINFSTGSGVLTTGSWYHVALVRNGSSFVIYVNGVSQGNTTSAHTIASFSTGEAIGFVSGFSGGIVGNLGEYRVSNIARWTTGFTPPASPYTAGSNGTPTLTLANQGTVLSTISTSSSTGTLTIKNNGISAVAITNSGNLQGQNGGNFNYSTFTCGANGYAGTPVTIGTTNSWTVPTAGKIISSTITGALSAGNCSCTIDIWKTNAAIPTVSNTITASALPALSTATYSQNTNLSGWTTSIAANDVIMCNIQSGCTCDNVNVVLGIAA